MFQNQAWRAAVNCSTQLANVIAHAVPEIVPSGERQFSNPGAQ